MTDNDQVGMERVKNCFLRCFSATDRTELAGNIQSGAEGVKTLANPSRGLFGGDVASSFLSQFLGDRLASASVGHRRRISYARKDHMHPNQMSGMPLSERRGVT